MSSARLAASEKARLLLPLVVIVLGLAIVGSARKSILRVEFETADFDAANVTFCCARCSDAHRRNCHLVAARLRLVRLAVAPALPRQSQEDPATASSSPLGESTLSGHPGEQSAERQAALPAVDNQAAGRLGAFDRGPAVRRLSTLSGPGASATRPAERGVRPRVDAQAVQLDGEVGPGAGAVRGLRQAQALRRHHRQARAHQRRGRAVREGRLSIGASPRSISLDFELYDFGLNQTLCCAYCPDDSGRRCQVTVSSFPVSWYRPCLADLKLPHYRDSRAMARAFRALPEDSFSAEDYLAGQVPEFDRERERFRVAWLAPSRRQADKYQLAERLLRFDRCEFVGRTQRSRASDAASALLDLYAMPGDPFRDVAFARYWVCDREAARCDVTFLRSANDLDKMLDLEDSIWD
ncbi:unnamed protein product [Trichogramma brassicae]|uniref:Uncharacterized protein n=1 Tax=Trichogramma brassicae TaxID=86971 RepID=A0A6H5IJ08_9HYME|nr:unnamed protein product [Trichogramma brassicae]